MVTLLWWGREALVSAVDNEQGLDLPVPVTDRSVMVYLNGCNRTSQARYKTIITTELQ